MLAAEKLPAEGGFVDLPERVDGEVRYHLWIMVQAGLLDAEFAMHEGTVHETVWLNELTWQGHEFLAAAQDDGVWRTAIRKSVPPMPRWSSTNRRVKPSVRVWAATLL